METSLHRELKRHLAASDDHTEIVVDDFRIDAIGRRGELIEIQLASLGAIREKIGKLLGDPRRHVRVVKPIIARKWIVTRQEPEGEILRRRLSPKRGDVLDIFVDLVHFSNIFPAPRLTLEVLLLDVEEQRVPRQKKWRRGKNYSTLDLSVVQIVSSTNLKSVKDLWRIFDSSDLPRDFDTAQLAAAMGRPRWLAQKAAYCLRTTKAVRCVGKKGNSQLYRSRYPHGFRAEIDQPLPMDTDNRWKAAA